MQKLRLLYFFNAVKVAFSFLLVFFINKAVGQVITGIKINGNNSNIHFCQGNTYTVTFDTLGFTTLNPIFRVELSDASGSFGTLTAASSLSNTLSHSLTVPGSAALSNVYKVRVVVTSPSSVSASDSIINITLTKPTAAFTINNNNACAGSNVSFNNTSTGVGILLYSWNFSATAGAPSSPNTNFAPTVQFNPAFGGGVINYLTTLIVTDGYGCTNSIGNNVSVKQKPNLSLDTNVSQSINGVEWDPLLVLFSNCTATPTNKTFTFSNNISSSTFATNSSIQIDWGDASSTLLTAPFLSSTLLNHIYSSLGYFNLNFIVNNLNGCSNSVNYNIYNGYLPSGGINNPGYLLQYCNPVTLPFPVDTANTNDNPPGTIYKFTVNDSSQAQVFNQGNLPNVIYHTFTKTSCGTTSYNGSTPYPNAFQASLNITNPCGSAGNSQTPLRIISKIIANFTSPNTICNNSNVIFTNSSTGNYFNASGTNCISNLNKLWSITPLTGWTLASGTMSPASLLNNVISINFINPGVYQIKLIVSQPSNPTPGCSSDTITKTICVQPTPAPNFTLNQNPTNGCTNSSVTLNNTSNTLSSCGIIQYKWFVYDSLTNNLITPGIRYTYQSGSNDSAINASINFTKAGKYKIRLQVTNSCGSFTKDTTITVKEKPLVVLPNSTIYCDSKTITFGASNPLHNPVYNANYGIIFSYNWTVTPSGYSFVVGSSSSANPTILFPNNTTSQITYTVTLTATNECGVSLPVTQQITINPKPIVTATSLPADTAFCSGGSTNISLSSNLPAGVAYTWRAYRSSINITGMSNQLTPSYGPIAQVLVNSGNSIETVTYKIAGTHAATNCLGDSTTIVITVYPIPRVIASSQAICSGSSTNIVLSSSVLPSLFRWTATTLGATTGFRDTSIAVAGPIVQTLINTSTNIDTVRYTIRTIANGCLSADTLIKVAIKPIPSITNTNLTQSICSGDTARLNPTSSVGSSTFNYTASLINGSATNFSGGVGAINQRLFNSGTTSSLVRYSINVSSNGCIGNAVQFEVTVNPIPVLSVFSTSSICSGSQTNIVLNSTPTGALFRYTATLLSGTNTTGFYSKNTDTLSPIAQVISNTGSTNAVVRYSITPSYLGCLGAPSNHDVTVFPGVNAGNVGVPATVCSGLNVGTLNLVGNTGAVVRWEQSVAPFSSWSNIANLTASQNYLNLTQTTWYRAVIQSGGTCPTVNTNPVIISVDSNSVGGNLIGNDTVCIGTNSGTINLINKRGSILNWQTSNSLPTWTDISATSLINPYTFNNLSQTTWFRVVVKNGVCPSVNSDSVKIQVDLLPTTANAPDKSACATSLTSGINDNLFATPLTSGIGLWTYVSGPNIPTIVSPLLNNSAITNMMVGTHKIEWKVSNGVCPASKDTLNFIIYPPIQSSISDSQTICSGQAPAVLLGTLPIGGSGVYTYQWQSSTDGINFINIPTATSSNFQPPVLTVNTWYRRVVNSAVCSQISNIVFISVLPAISNNVIAANSSICIGNMAPTISGNIPNGGSLVFKYQWQKLVGASWVNTSVGDTLINFSPGYLLVTTSYRRVVISGSCNGLQASISNTVTITVNALPIVNAGADSTKCQNQFVYNLNGTPSGGTWSGVGVVANTFNPSAMSIGSYTLVYTFTNANGCTNRDTAIISVIAPPIVNAGNDFSICQNANPFQLSGFSPTGGTWSGTGVTATGLFNPTTAGAGTFSLVYSFVAGNCSGRDTLLVTVNPKPDGNFVLPTQICPNSVFTLTTSTNISATITGYNWGVTNNGGLANNILSSNNTINPIINIPENKTSVDVLYTIKLVTSTNFGCIDSISKTIFLRKRPNVQFTTGSNINCGPALYSIINGTSNTVNSYLWSVNPSSFVSINTPTSTNPNITLPVNNGTNTLTYNIRLIATRNDGIASCVDTLIKPVIVYPKPSIGFNLSPSDSGCSPLVVNFTNASNPQNSEPTSTMSFLWNLGTLGADTGLNIQKTFTNSGVIDSIYNIKVTGTTVWGCKDSLTKTVKVFPFPKSNFTSTIYTSCAPFLINNSIITLTQYQSANDSYLWQILNKSGAVISSSLGTTVPNFTINTPNDTVYYRLITSNMEGCKPDTLVRMFITIPNPIPNFSISDSVGCSPLNISFTNNSSVGVISNWTFSNGASAGTGNPFNLTFGNNSNTLNATYTAKLVITAGTGCKDSIIKTITVYPKPKASFTIPSTTCANSTISPVNNSVFKPSNAFYGWKIIEKTSTNINDTNTLNPVFSFVDNQGISDSTLNIRLRVTSIDGCIHDTIKSIIINRRPLSNFTVPSVSCGPSTLLVTNNTNINGSSWNWSSSPNLTITTPTSQNPTILFPQNSTNDSINYSIKLIATRNGTSCTDSIQKIVTIYPKPQANFTIQTKDSCGPRNVVFTNTSNAKNGENLTSMTYLWSLLNTSFSSLNTSGLFTNNSTIDSNYNIRLIGTSKHGCKDTINQSVKVWPNAKASFTYTNNISCAPFSITSSVVVANKYPQANLNYRWYANNSLIGIDSVFPGYNLLSANDSILIKLVTISKNGCKNDSMEVWFKTIPNPVPNFNMSDSVGCSPLNISFTNNSSAGVISNWIFSNGASAGTGNPFNLTFGNNSNTLNATYTAKLVITAGTGCKDSITKTVTVYPKPKASFTIPNTACANSTISAVNNSVFKPNNAFYGWKIIENTNTSISDTNTLNPVFSFVDNQAVSDSTLNIRLRVTSVDGCIHDTIKSIIINRRPLANFTVPLVSCGPNSVLVTNNTNITSSSWNWSSSPNLTITTPTSQNPTLSFPQNSTNDSINYSIKLVAIRNGTTCTDSIQKIVTIYPKPQANFTIQTKDSCGPRNVVFTNTSNAKNGENITSMTYLWSLLNTSTSNLNTSGLFSNNSTIDSNYNVQLIATSKHGCKDTISQNVKVWPNAKASFTYTNNISCAPFNITSSNIQPIQYPQANITYQWYANNTFLGNGLTFPGYVINNQNDSVLIKLKTISLNGCKNDSLEVWFKTIENPKPNFVAMDSVGCSPLFVNFINTSAPLNGLTYKWEFGNNSNQSIAKNPSFNFFNYGNFDTTIIVKLIVIAGGTGCKDSVEKQIVVKPLPNPDFNLSDSVLCFPNHLTVSNSSLNNPAYRINQIKWKVTGPDLASIINDTASTFTTIHFTDNQTGLNKLYQIRLIIKSNFGCEDSIQKTIRIPTRPIANFGFSTDSSCAPIIVATNNISQYVSTFNWYSFNSNVIVNNPSLPNTSIVFPSHKGIVDSVYLVRLIAQTSLGCSDTLIKPFKVFPLPISNFTLDKDSGCSPLNITFFNNSISKKPSNSVWNFGDGVIQTNNLDTLSKSFVGSVFQDTSYTVKLITTSVNGCKDTTNRSIKVKSSAFAKIKLVDTLLCSSLTNPTKLRIENKSYGSVDTFYWDFGDGNTLVTTSDSVINHPYSSEGLFKIVLKAVNSCKVTFDSAFIKIQTPPNVNFTKSDSVGCSPLSVSFNNLSTNTFEAKYLWDFGNGNTSTLFNPHSSTYLQSRTSDTTYFVSLKVSNICGIFEKTDSVKVFPKPIAVFLTSSDSGCSPLPVYMINQSVGLPISYKWYFGNGDSSSRFNPLQIPVTYRTIDTISYFTIKLIATNTCGIDSMEKTIKVFPNTVNSFFTTSGNTICQNTTVRFNDFSTGGSNISWNLGDGNTSLLKNPTHTYTTAGTYYAYQYVNNGCSFDTSFVIINVLANPSFTISKSVPQVCVNSQVQFNANLKDSGVITWYFGDGDSSNSFNPVHIYKSAGKKIITVQVKSFYNSCISYKTDSILVSPIPQINTSLDTNQACAYKVFNFTANSPQTNIFNWDFGDSNTASGSFVKHLYQNGGTFNVRIVAQTTANCYDTVYKQVIVFPVPIADFSFTPKDTCTGPVNVKFTNLSTGALNYLWDFGNGNTSNNINPTFTYINVGVYPIKLISSNQFNCFDTAENKYFVYQTPNAALDFSPDKGCPPLDVKFENKSSFGTSYFWDFGDGETDTLFSPKHTYIKSGIYNVKLVAIAGGYCFDTLVSAKTITVFSKPTPAFTHLLQTDKKPYRTVLFNSLTDSVSRFEWFYKGRLIGRGKNPTFRFDDADSGMLEIVLKIVSIDGCDSSIIQTIELPPYWNGLYVPNAFTPTLGQGGANEFKPIGIELKYYHVRVFNKWGELMWESTKLDENGVPMDGWDGNDRAGLPCPQGSYVWVVEGEFTDGKAWKGMKLDDGNLHTKGNVTLIR